MTSARDIRVAPIDRRDADRLIKREHYSGSVTKNSQLHFGVFLNGQIEGAMQFGPSMDKTKIQPLVRDTPWHNFIELNRMAFSARLPRNSESRALGVVLRLIRKQYPKIQWVVSFADATCCGDGTIYRAAGFALTGIRKNKTIVTLPNGKRSTGLVLTANWNEAAVVELCRELGIPHRFRPLSEWYKLGVRVVPGFQLRYIYFLDPTARERLTVPILPYSAIDEAGAGMYRGQAREAGDGRGPPEHSGGAAPTPALHIEAGA